MVRHTRTAGAYQCFHSGNFGEAKDEFDALLHMIPLTVAETRSEVRSNKMTHMCVCVRTCASVSYHTEASLPSTPPTLSHSTHS